MQRGRWPSLLVTGTRDHTQRIAVLVARMGAIPLDLSDAGVMMLRPTFSMAVLAVSRARGAGTNVIPRVIRS